MRLDNIKKEPFKIISFAIITLFFSYFITGEIIPAVSVSFLSFWFCLMPKLDYKHSLYKKKIPKFLRKGDLLNKILLIGIPLCFTIAYAVTYSGKELNKLTSMGIILIPILLSLINYAVALTSKSDVDWVTPYITSFLTVLCTEIILGNGKYVFEHIFKNPTLDYLWIFVLQIFFVYSFFRILSLILPGRTLATGVSSGLFIIFAFISNLLVGRVNMTFKPAELLNIKDTFAMITVLLKEKTEIWKVAGSSLLSLVCIVGIAFLLYNKRATTYDLMKRVKSCFCGAVILIISIFGIKLLGEMKDVKIIPETNYGYIYTIMANPMQKNTYNGEFLEKINAQKEEIKKKSEENKKGTSSTTPQQGTTSTTPQNNTTKQNNTSSANTSGTIGNDTTPIDTDFNKDTDPNDVW